MANPMDGYVEVKDRIVIFRDKHPEGCLRPVNPDEPYKLEFIEVEGKPRCFIVYAAAAYRTPDDPMPGIGVAWEPMPGLTAFTRNSELMNAETSAWGRAIVAVLAADAGPIATGEDVRKRAAEDGKEPTAADKPITTGRHAEKPPRATDLASEAQVKAVWATSKAAGMGHDELIAYLEGKYGEGAHPDTINKRQASETIDALKKMKPEDKPAETHDPDLEAYKVAVATADLAGHKAELVEFLGNPNAGKAAFAAWKALTPSQRDEASNIAEYGLGEVPF